MTNRPNLFIAGSRPFYRILFLACFSIGLITLNSCGDGGDGDPGSDSTFSDDLAVVQIFDIGNQQNANDIYVSIRFNSARSSGELRVMIAKGAAVEGITADDIKNQPATAYTSLEVTSALVTGRLNSQQTDIDGDGLTLETQYKILVYNVADETIAHPSAAFTITDAAALTGDYIGTWDDNFYTAFGISAKITGNGNSYTGEFYYTNGFTACCGGATDGDISFELENQQIKNFVYDQDLITYMGGCPGLYNGSGRLEDEITLNINFGGDDCDGTHVGGVMKLTRVK